MQDWCSVSLLRTFQQCCKGNDSRQAGGGAGFTRFSPNSDVHVGGNVVKPWEVAFEEQILDNILSNCYTTLCHQLHPVLNVRSGEASKHLWGLPREVEAHNGIWCCPAHHFSLWVLQFSDWVDVTCEKRRNWTITELNIAVACSWHWIYNRGCDWCIVQLLSTAVLKFLVLIPLCPLYMVEAPHYQKPCETVRNPFCPHWMDCSE